MKREYALDAYSVRYLANGKRRAIAAAVHLDHKPLERLNSLFLAFDHFDLKAKSITHTESGEIFAYLAVFDLLDDAVHGQYLGTEPVKIPKEAPLLNSD